MSRIVVVGIAIVLILLPLPAGSHRFDAERLFAALVALLALLAVADTGGAMRLDRTQRCTVLLWLLWLLWLAVQWLPLPAEWLQRFAPASYEAYARVAAAGGSPVWRISLSPLDTQWMLWLSLVYGVWYLLILCVVRTPSAARGILLCVIASAVAQAVFGTAMVMSGLELNAFGHKTAYIGSATGTFVNRNHFAGYLEIGGALATGLILARFANAAREKRRLRLWFRDFIEALLTRNLWLRLGLLVIVVGLVASRSRMGALAFLTAVSVGSVLFLGFRGRGGRLRGLFFLITVIVIDGVLVGGQFGLDELLQRFAYFRVIGDMRVTTFGDLYDMASHYATSGIGLGSFAYAYPQFRSASVYAFNDHAHNDYAEFLIETGIVGFAILASLVTLVCGRALAIIAQRKDVHARGVALGGLLALGCIALHSLTDFNLQIPANAATVVAILALIAGLSPRRRQSRTAAAPPGTESAQSTSPVPR
ncbi:MAG TPA: O-antigen ligase family protein [Solimonas sp.]|nr:O-antigen ligase family protein [Solimonas sp.]